MAATNLVRATDWNASHAGGWDMAVSNTTYSSGTVVLSGGANVTIGTNGQTITISAGGGAGTGISGLANSETTYTSGSVTLSGEANITIRSTTGQQFRFSVHGQQTGISGISNSETTYTSGTVGLSVVGGALTIRSTTGNAFQFSASQSAQTGISGLSNSNTTYTSGTVGLSELGAITIRSTTGNQFQFSVNSQTVQTQSLIQALYDGAASITTGTVRFTNANNITFTINGQTMSGSVHAQQTGISGISNSETTYTSGTVGLSVVGGPMTIRSTTGNAFQFSVAAAPAAQTGISGISNSETTYTSGTVGLSVVGGALTIRSTTGNAFQFSASQSVQTQNMVAISATNTLYSSGTVLFTGSNMITVKSSAAGQTIILDATQSVQTQNVVDVTLAGNSTSGGAGYQLISSGTMRLAGGNNITLSQDGQSVTISGAAAGGAQTAISGLANSETTYTSGSVTLSALGAITIRSTTGQHFQFSVNSQTAQTGISGISNSETTYTSGTVGLSVVGGAMTIRSTTGNAFQFSVSQSVQAAQTGISGISNSNTTYTSGTVGLSELANITIRSTTGNQFQFSVAAQSNQQMTLFATSNTTQSSTGTTNASSLIFAGAGAASVGISNGSIVISAPNAGAGNVTFSGGASSGGLASIVFSNSNGVSFGLNASTMTASVAAQSNQQMTLFATSNTTQSSTGTTNASSLIFAGAGVASVGITNGSVVISVPSGGGFTRSGYEPYDEVGRFMGVQGQSTLHIAPVYLPDVAFDRILFPLNFVGIAGTSTGAATISLNFGLYTKNASTLSLLSSASTTTAFTHGTASSSAQNGWKLLSIASTGTLTEGHYWAGVLTRTASAVFNASISQNLMSQMNTNLSGMFGVASNASNQFPLGLGVYSAGTTNVIASIPFTDIRGTAILAMQKPVWYVTSGTA